MKKSPYLFMTRCALLASCSLVLSVIEMMLPYSFLPMFGAKAGLSNIVIIISAETLGLPYAIMIAVIKAVFSLVTRGFSAFLMSFTGGLAATIVMYIVLHTKKVHFGYLGIGIFGAVTHNLAQLVVALLLTSRAVIYYTPVLLAVSLVAGALTGLSAGFLAPVAKKIIYQTNKL